MLSDQLVNLLCQVSSAARFGLTAGLLCGMFVGVVLQALRTRRIEGALLGLFLGTVPGAFGSASIAIVIGLVEVVVCPAAHKGGYQTPDWFVVPTLCAILLASGISVTTAISRFRSFKRSRCWVFLEFLLWGTTGALLASLANLGPGFDGYFCCQSNERVIRFVAEGAVVGSTVALVWKTSAQTLVRRSVRRCPSGKRV
jgi:hypothetical protein